MTKNEILTVKEILANDLMKFKGFYFNRNVRKNLKVVEEYIEDIKNHINDLKPEGFDKVETSIEEYNEKIKEFTTSLTELEAEYKGRLNDVNRAELNEEYSPLFKALNDEAEKLSEPLKEEYKESITAYEAYNKAVGKFLQEEADDLEFIKIKIENVPDLVLDNADTRMSIVLEELIED